jgi:hypothetical protein
VAVPYARAGDDLCPVRTLQAYLEAGAIHRGPVFRRMRRGDTLTSERLSDQSVALIVKRRAATASIRPGPPRATARPCQTWDNGGDAW